MLAVQPEAGYQFFVRRPELQGMRRFPVSDGFESILLFYFPLVDGIELVRVVHGKSDLERLLMQPIKMVVGNQRLAAGAVFSWRQGSLKRLSRVLEEAVPGSPGSGFRVRPGFQPNG